MKALLRDKVSPTSAASYSKHGVASTYIFDFIITRNGPNWMEVFLF